MTCSELAVEELMDHLLGDLDEAAERQVAAHVAVCPDCRESLQTLGRLREVVWATREFQDIKVPPEVHGRILERCREALAAIEAMRGITSAPLAGLQPMAAVRPSRHGPRLRALVYVAAGLVGAVGFFLAFQFLLSTGSEDVGVLESTSGRVEVIPAGQTEGFAAGAGQPLTEGDRVRIARLAASARVRLAAGGMVHIGGGTTVRFLGPRRAEILTGRAFAEASGRSVTVSAGGLLVTGSSARFDLRLLEPPAGVSPAVGIRAEGANRFRLGRHVLARSGERSRGRAFSVGFASRGRPIDVAGRRAGSASGPILAAGPDAPESPPAGRREVILTVVGGSVRYASGATEGELEAGWQLRVTGRGIVPRQVETEPFWARWMTDADCDALSANTLRRLIKGPFERLAGGRVRLTYGFATEAEMADWRRTAGAGVWGRGPEGFRGKASTGARALVYHVARFLGDLEVQFDVAVGADAPRSQTLWRIYAEPGPWEVSGFSGWAAVERLEASKLIRKVSVFYLDQTRASAPAPGLSDLNYHVAVRCAGGRLTFSAGGEPALACAVGEAPTSGHVGLGVAGGDVHFRNLVLTGRLQPDWIRHALEQLAETDLAQPVISDTNE